MTSPPSRWRSIARPTGDADSTELAEIERVVERADRLHRKAREQGDNDYFDGVALNLHGFYAGAERIFATIAREVDSAVPTGP